MSGFLSNLKQQLQQAAGQTKPWGDVNPLVVIGLTEAVLDLKLNEEQLHAAVRSFARQLAAQVHPDRATDTVSAERQKKIIEAFDYIDSFANFHQALADFKQLKAEDRRENRILQEALSNLRNQVAGYDQRLEELSIRERKLKEDRGAFQLLKEEEPLQVPQLEDQLSTARAELKEQQRLLQGSKLNASDWKNRFEGVATYLNEFDHSRNCTHPRFFEAKWVAVVSLCPFRLLGPTPTSTKSANDFREAVASIERNNPTELEEELRKKWTHARDFFRKNRGFSASTDSLAFTLLYLDQGIPGMLFGSPNAGWGGRVIGSVRSADQSGFTRKDLQHTIDQRDIMQRMTPQIVPGNILLSMTTDPRRKAIWSLTCPAFIFTCKRYILAAG